MPLELVYDPPLIEYVPPVMEMGVAVSIPDTVMVFDVITVLNATFVRSVKVNWSGVVSGPAGGSVVTLKVSDTPPIVSIAFVVVELLPDEVCRTVTVSLLLTVPQELVYDPVLILYSPPVIDMIAAVLMPVTVIVFDVITVLSATLV